MALRPFGLALLLLALIAIGICATTAFGEYRIPIRAVLEALVGKGDPVNVLIVRTLRLPRVIECVLTGAALGLSGAIFQALTRNPLASPDLIGVNEGAAVAAVWLILAGAPANLVLVGAFIGALVAIAIVGAIGIPRNFTMYRLILIGVGINAFCAAVVAYLLVRGSNARQLDSLAAAEQWLAGSVAGSSWQTVRLIALTMVVLVPITAALSIRLNVLQLGDDIPTALGITTIRTQVALAAVGALLAAAAVAVAGPIGFVAFVSPHIARRLARTSSSASLPVAMGIGALIVLLADYVAKRILEPTELPVGVVTVIIGAPYLLFLLYKADRDSGVG